MLQLEEVDHARFIAARVETGDFHRDVVFILVLDLAAEHHAVLHHLHMDFRIADGVLNGARHAAVIARDVHSVLSAPSAIRPDDEGGRPCFLPDEEEISRREKLHIGDGRIPDRKACDAGSGHVFRFIQRHLDRFSGAGASKGEHRSCEEESDSFFHSVHLTAPSLRWYHE